MGVAQSKNTAKAVSKIANSVSSNTTTSNNQIQSIRNDVILRKCVIGGDVNIDIVAQFAAKSRQIIKAYQNTNIQNSIAQQMQQAAQSTVGSLGIGYAEASNYVSTYASASTDIANYVYTVSDQSSFSDTSIVCNNSVIKGDFNINLTYTTSFWNDQGVESDQINKISNTITQTVDQKATAKVQGIAGLLIVLAIIIALIGYTISKPIGKAFKALGPIMVVIALIVVVIIVVFMYIKETPPFFSEQQTCSTSGNAGNSDCSFNNCVDSNHQSVSLNKPPIKYMYNIIGTQTGGSRTTLDNLGMLNMVLFSSSNSSNYQFNQGYNALSCKEWAGDLRNGDTFSLIWNKDNTYKNYGVPQLPNPFIIPSTTDKDGNPVYYVTPSSYNYIENPDQDSNTPSVYSPEPQNANFISKSDFMKLQDKDLLQVTAQLNVQGWLDYFNVTDGQLFGDTMKKQKLKRALHARYILTLANGLDNTVYIFDGSGTDMPVEEVSYMDKTIFSNSDEAKKYCYKYTPDSAPRGMDYTKMIPENTTGVISGKIGVCNTRQNKLNKFLTHSGNYILITAFCIMFIIMFWIMFKKYRTK